jgi:hypothetical protein
VPSRFAFCYDTLCIESYDSPCNTVMTKKNTGCGLDFTLAQPQFIFKLILHSDKRARLKYRRVLGLGFSILSRLSSSRRQHEFGVFLYDSRIFFNLPWEPLSTIYDCYASPSWQDIIIPLYSYIALARVIPMSAYSSTVIPCLM